MPTVIHQIGLLVLANVSVVIADRELFDVDDLYDRSMQPAMPPHRLQLLLEAQPPLTPIHMNRRFQDHGNSDRHALLLALAFVLAGTLIFLEVCCAEVLGWRSTSRNNSHNSPPDSFRRVSRRASFRLMMNEQDDPATELAVKLFNSGMGRRATTNLGISDSVDELASWLHGTAHLDCEHVGDLLGHKNEAKLLDAYVGKLCFDDLSLDRALRRFLSNFMLKGDAQSIERMLESFAKHWCKSQANCGSIGNDARLTPDEAHIFVYATIQLNTDLHNCELRKNRSFTPMSLDSFKDNCRPVFAEYSPSTDVLLEETYRSVQAEEIILRCNSTKIRADHTLLSAFSHEEVSAKIRAKQKFKAGVQSVIRRGKSGSQSF